MSETLRETIRKAAEDSLKYYQLLEAESDRGLVFLPWRFSKSSLRKAIESRDVTFKGF